MTGTVWKLPGMNEHISKIAHRCLLYLQEWANSIGYPTKGKSFPGVSLGYLWHLTLSTLGKQKKNVCTLNTNAISPKYFSLHLAGSVDVECWLQYNEILQSYRGKTVTHNTVQANWNISPERETGSGVQGHPGLHGLDQDTIYSKTQSLD